MKTTYQLKYSAVVVEDFGSYIDIVETYPSEKIEDDTCRITKKYAMKIVRKMMREHAYIFSFQDELYPMEMVECVLNSKVQMKELKFL